VSSLRPLDAWPQARAWLDEALAAHGLTPAGSPDTLKVRPWSMVARVPVTGGTVWFKANGPGSRYEAGLLAALGRHVPQWTIEPLAVEPEQGWSLLPDGGATLREAEHDPSGWERFLAAHAQLQLELLPHVTELAGLGVPCLPVAALPERLDALLADDDVWVPAADGLRDRIRAYTPSYRDACAQLAAGRVPVSLQHDDLHDGNVLAEGTRFFDWGDAYLGHPFAVLLVTLRSARHAFSLELQDPALRRMRDAYLEPWAPYGTPAELVAEASLAVEVAKVARALSWQRALVAADQDSLREWGDSVSGWLGELLEP